MSTAVEACCPACGTVSRQRHGQYRRALNDVTVSGRRTVIDLVVRRFRCAQDGCRQRTFSEQIAGLTERFARRTPRLRQVLERLMLVAAGRPAARLTQALAFPVSANTLLRLLRRRPTPQRARAPRVLGVDDFALRKGHVYGTILLDMETGERVDVLPDRTAKTLTAWLRAHPGAEIVCRDRGGAYAEAVRTAAPNAVQVADRFHVWRNLCDAVEKCVVLHRDCLPVPADELTGGPAPKPASLSAPAEHVLEKRVSAEWDSVRASTRRQRHAEVHGLREKGVGISAIAEALGLDRKTVRRYAHAATPEDMVSDRAGQRSSRIDPFLPYLHDRWNAGCTDGARLFAEIRDRGYTGSQRTLRRHLQAVRASGKPAPTIKKQLSVRRATILLTSHPTHLDENAALRRKGLLGRCPELDTVAACVAAFATMMADLDGHRLPAWLDQAHATGLQPLRSLVNGIRQDLAAVTAGLTLHWNSGRVEGNVNRIKRIKRDGYGRASFDLLRHQILHAD
ncbi:ISL3 family transposase [Kineosporia sp. J2-2]|uniref:ISL3 family transposase n=1 Tax=Kineosporia corallincola TaxID=2835133 RepID=A0ABS5TTL8_9ACTN|nr:ISL3 family transposase [Kineosporia corallincola]MBT0774141.1 ISL3 family transposase [Kineosporia corallincola]